MALRRGAPAQAQVAEPLDDHRAADEVREVGHVPAVGGGLVERLGEARRHEDREVGVGGPAPRVGVSVHGHDVLVRLEGDLAVRTHAEGPRAVVEGLRAVEQLGLIQGVVSGSITSAGLSTRTPMSTRFWEAASRDVWPRRRPSPPRSGRTEPRGAPRRVGEALGKVRAALEHDHLELRADHELAGREQTRRPRAHDHDVGSLSVHISSLRRGSQASRCEGDSDLQGLAAVNGEDGA